MRYNRKTYANLTQGSSLRRRLLFLLAPAVFIVSPHEAAANMPSPDTCNFTEKIYFKLSSSDIDPDFGGNTGHMERMRRFLEGRDSLESLKITVTGSASPEGEREYNRHLAKSRAKALVNLIGSHGAEGFVYTITAAPAMTIQAEGPESLRFAELSAQYLKGCRHDSLCQICNRHDAATLTADEPEQKHTAAADVVGSHTVPTTSITSDRVTAVATDAVSESSPTRIFFTTNLLYDALLTPNIGVGIYLGKRMTLFADWMHAWWDNRSRRRYWRIYGGDLELRMQLGGGRADNPLSGHRLGVYASIVTYDFQFGRSHTGVMGDKYNYAAGLSYGYSLPIGRRLSLDFALGVGYAWGKYMKQHLEDDHDVWLSTHTRRWFGPTRAEISLVWLVGAGNINARKAKKGGRL